MSDRGRGKSRGRATAGKQQQQGLQQQLPHAQLSISQEVRRPGQLIAQIASTSVSIYFN